MHSLFTNNWLPIEQLEADHSHWQYSWLISQGSLTQRLQGVCRADFNVEVLQHTLVTATSQACQALSLPAGAKVLHREVLLCDGETPLVFACSILPEQALTGRYAELIELGSRPLGHWIFAEPVLHREVMSYRKLDGTDALFGLMKHKTDLPNKVYGRKTLFTGADKPFLVSEFFLPNLQPLSHC
jgi:chorismate--pyruvate lyase